MGPSQSNPSNIRQVRSRGRFVMRQLLGGLAALLVSLLVIIQSVHADEGVEFFEKKIRPVLVKHCYECHSASAEEVKGGLRLDSREAIRTGGDTGPAIVPSKVVDSLLLEAIRHESLEMPPNERLPNIVIADFQRWIAMGAPDPRDQPPSALEAADLAWQATLQSRRQWWSLLPPVAPEVPNVNNGDWSDHPIDRFVLSKLDGAGLSAAVLAAPHTLIRRLSLVLIGLPPTPSETSAFLSAYTSDPDAAYSCLVDRLLESPHFGERWARHWMDVVRFTETHGNEWNYEVHHAWRYRDYLIRALNDDVPYDQLIREHIAGDLITEPRWNPTDNINESVIGTAFYRFGEANHDDCIGLRSIGFDLADNRIDTLTKTFQATTVSCARCHDHKMDAVSMKDYYALLGILRSSRLVAHTIDAPAVNAEPMRRLAELKTEIHRKIADRWLEDMDNVAGYLLAADAARCERADAEELAAKLDDARLANWLTAVKIKQPPLDHPLAPWLALGDDVANNWRELNQQYAAEHAKRQDFNDKNFHTFADFRSRGNSAWKTSGQGLRTGKAKSGDFLVASEGDAVIAAVLPTGLYTHLLSEKLNGALRSPLLLDGKKQISFRVLGDHTSAVRLVSNNCQLNYQNYHALTDPTFQWITFSPPDDSEGVRIYAELITKFDNPKFPDQLGTLGSDTQNDRIPWKEAAADPRSYWGVTHVVTHDCTETPQPKLDHLLRLFTNDSTAHPQSLADVSRCYTDLFRRAIVAWSEDRTTDTDVRLLDWLVKSGLIDNSLQQTPRLAELVAEYRAIENNELAVPRIIPGIEDTGVGFDQPILVRGDSLRPGDVVPRRYLEVLSGSDQVFSHYGSGRLELAELIASAENPFTARVMVNRVWHHLFGTGIVRSVDDFGHVGEPPSHPELLDYIALKFIEQDWSIKQLIREIVHTQTFRMTGRATALAREIDPDNRLLHHYPTRRLDAEAIRDSILFTSGRLDPTLFGLSVQPYRDKAIIDRRLFVGPLDGDGRRSLYTKVSLMEGNKFLETFNAPGGKVTQGRRDVTNIPAQALALLNDSFVIGQAAYWADRLVQRDDDTIKSRLEAMFGTALGRSPSVNEVVDFSQLAHSLARFHQIESSDILSSSLLWQDVAHVIFNLKELIYIP
ncbi:MAG: PSD1 and planctomycete cytochrome C domain-containing protein [Pirellulales bacterium]